jgi:hypothetical protein
MVRLNIFTLMTHQTCLIGYPPADSGARQFLTREVTSPLEVKPLMQCFLIALFKMAAGQLRKEARPSGTKIEQIQIFRDFMSKDQKFEIAGVNRRTFYKDVIKEADQLVRRK